MSKRKSRSESLVEPEEGTKVPGVDQPHNPTSLSHSIAYTGPTAQTDREKVPGKPNGPEPTTNIGARVPAVTSTGQANQLVPAVAPLAVGESHVIPSGVPVGPGAGLAVPLTEGEDPVARWFWNLLRDAGYEVW